MKGLGTSQLWGCCCVGGAHTAEPCGLTGVARHPWLPPPRTSGRNWLLSVFSARWQLNLASRRFWQ